MHFVIWIGILIPKILNTLVLPFYYGFRILVLKDYIKSLLRAIFCRNRPISVWRNSECYANFRSEIIVFCLPTKDNPEELFVKKVPGRTFFSCIFARNSTKSIIGVKFRNFGTFTDLCISPVDSKMWNPQSKGWNKCIWWFGVRIQSYPKMHEQLGSEEKRSKSCTLMCTLGACVGTLGTNEAFWGKNIYWLCMPNIAGKVGNA